MKRSYKMSRQDLKGYTAAEVATYNTLKAAQSAPGQNLSAGTASAEALRAHVNSVGVRMFNDQAAAYKAGTLTNVNQDGA
jgi:hypothetical protein